MICNISMLTTEQKLKHFLGRSVSVLTSDCGTSCAVGTLNEACDTCVCESTVIEGRVLTTFENPVGYAVLAEASAPSKMIAESNSTGFFALNATCLTSTVIVSREGFQDAVVEITKTNPTVYLELEGRYEHLWSFTKTVSQKCLDYVKTRPLCYKRNSYFYLWKTLTEVQEQWLWPSFCYRLLKFLFVEARHF